MLTFFLILLRYLRFFRKLEKIEEITEISERQKSDQDSKVLVSHKPDEPGLYDQDLAPREPDPPEVLQKLSEAEEMLTRFLINQSLFSVYFLVLFLFL